MLTTRRRGLPDAPGSAAGVVSSGVSTNSNSCMILLFVLVTVLITVDRVVLAQRITFPIFRQQQALQIRMIPEANPEKVEDLALVPVRRAPDGNHGIELALGLGDSALQTHAQFPAQRMKMIDHFESRIGGIPVDGRDRTETNELLLVFKKAANVHDRGGINQNRKLAALGVAAGDGGRMILVEGGGYGKLTKRFREH